MRSIRSIVVNPYVGVAMGYIKAIKLYIGGGYEGVSINYDRDANRTYHWNDLIISGGWRNPAPTGTIKK